MAPPMELATSSASTLRRRRLLLGALVLLFALALRLVFFIGYANVDPWDDTLYLELARAVGGGAPAVEAPHAFPASAFAARRGVYYPIALAQTLFGANEIAASIPALLASLGLAAIAFRLGLRFGGEEAALWSGLLAALFPLDVAYSTRITPDAPVAFWMTASVWLALEAGWAERPAGRRALYAAGGLALLGAAWTRLSGLVILPVVGLALGPALVRRRTRAEPLAIVLVLAAGLVGDGLWQWWRQGSFWAIPSTELALQEGILRLLPEARFHPLPGLVLHLSYMEGSLHHFFKEAFGVVETYPSVSLFSIYAPMGAAALLGGLAFARTRLLSVWGLFLFAFFQYGFRDLALEPDGLHYYLVAPRPRHLLAASVPVAVLSGLGLAGLRARSGAACFLLASVVAAASLHAASENHAFYRGSMRDLRVAAGFLDDASEPIYADAWARAQLPLYVSGGVELRRPTSPLPEGALVLMGGSRGFDVSSESVASSLPEPLRSLHLGEASVSAGTGEVFRVPGELHVARRSDLVIARVPPPAR